MVWHSHLSKNFPQFVVIYTVQGFKVVNEAIVDDFLLTVVLILMGHPWWPKW